MGWILSLISAQSQWLPNYDSQTNNITIILNDKKFTHPSPRYTELVTLGMRPAICGLTSPPSDSDAQD